MPIRINLGFRDGSSSREMLRPIIFFDHCQTGVEDFPVHLPCSREECCDDRPHDYSVNPGQADPPGAPIKIRPFVHLRIPTCQERAKDVAYRVNYLSQEQP